MTKYLLADRERNMPDDSDFYAVFYDSETGQIGSEEYGSTRYAGGYRVAPPHIYLPPTSEIIPLAREAAIAQAAAAKKIQDFFAVNEPNSVARGDRLVLLVDGSFKDKKTGEKIAYHAGDAGTVIWEGTFGTFYANGYKRPNRSNTRVGLRLDDGRTVFVALEKCRLEREVKPDAELRNEAAYDCRMLYPALWN